MALSEHPEVNLGSVPLLDSGWLRMGEEEIAVSTHTETTVHSDVLETERSNSRSTTLAALRRSSGEHCNKESLYSLPERPVVSGPVASDPSAVGQTVFG